MASVFKQNFKLKNISYIASKRTQTKPNFNLYLNENNTSKRGKSNQRQYQCSKRFSPKSSSSLLKTSNELLSSKRNAMSQSRKGYYTRQDIDQIIMASSSFSRMFITQSQYHKKGYSGSVTEANKVSHNSSDYLLASSPSTSSSIGKNKANALKNINVFYSELSKHLKKDPHNMSNRHSQTKSQSRSNTKGNKTEDHSNEIKGNSLKQSSHLQPSTKETKESSENNKKDKEHNQNLFISPNSQTRNIKSDYHQTDFNYNLPTESYTSKTQNQSKRINSNQNHIDTPEELHYLYVSILQNGKEIELNFDNEGASS